MSDITLVSQNYSDDHYLGITKGDGSVFVDGPVVFKDGIYMPGGSPFITGPEFNRLSAFVSGPDAQVQGKLIASTGINLNNNTISVNTATSVGTSTLPVTAAAVNTKLSNYVNSVSSPDGSITVSKSGSSVTLKTKGGNYVPLGSYGESQQSGALPIGSNSTASGVSCTASGVSSWAEGSMATAYGYSSKAFNSSFAAGPCAKAGRESWPESGAATAVGLYSNACGDLAQVFGAYGRNADGFSSVIAAVSADKNDGELSNYQVTQLYLIPAGSPLADTYCGGEAGLGFITTVGNNRPWNDSWTIAARGTKKLSALLNDHTSDFNPNLTRD